VKEVKTGVFPKDDHCYQLIKESEEEYYEMLKEFK